MEAGKHPKINPYSLFETPEAAISDLFPVADFPEPTEYPFIILEPQAGKGAIARALRHRYPMARIDCYEIDPVNREILRGQGFNVVGDDFLKAPSSQDYDLIAMNPPFENKNWIEHLLKAHSLLKPSGTLAAVVPDSATRKGEGAALERFQKLMGKCGYAEDNAVPFEGTKVETLLIKLRAWSLQDERRFFQAHEGFSSMALYILMRSATSDSDLNRAIGKRRNTRAVAGLIESFIYRLMAEDRAFFYWDDSILLKAANLMIHGVENQAPEFPELPLFNTSTSTAA